MDEQKPSIGRIVVYNHPGSADGLYPRKQSPGIIQKVNEDGTCELVVFSVYGGMFFNHNVKRVEGEAHFDSRWDFPARV